MSRRLQAQEKEAQGGRTHIDEFTHAHHGVWWPDSLGMCMAWRSDGMHVGVGTLMNPFVVIPNDWIVEFWTEKLPSEAKDLQWAMALPDAVESNRSNRGACGCSDVYYLAACT